MNRVDVHVGFRVRTVRESRGLRIEELAEALAISSAQLEVYESGAERFPSARLVLIGKTLRISTSCFFEGLSAFKTQSEPTALQSLIQRLLTTAA